MASTRDTLNPLYSIPHTDARSLANTGFARRATVSPLALMFTAQSYRFCRCTEPGAGTRPADFADLFAPGHSPLTTFPDEPGMGQEGWPLKSNPFFLTNGEYFLAGRHEEALARLLFVVEQHGRCGVVLGRTRLGKSRLLQEVARHASDRQRMVFALDVTGFSRHDFARALAHTPGRPETASFSSPWDPLTNLLVGFQAADISGLWLIDHLDDAAESLDLELLRLIRLIERHGGMGTVLVAVRESLSLRPWSTHVELSITLEPWSSEECRQFLQQRLQAAGIDCSVFDDSGYAALASASAGNPAALLRLCQLALHAAWTLNRSTIDHELVEELCREFSPGPSCQRVVTPEWV